MLFDRWVIETVNLFWNTVTARDINDATINLKAGRELNLRLALLSLPAAGPLMRVTAAGSSFF